MGQLGKHQAREVSDPQGHRTFVMELVRESILDLENMLFPQCLYLFSLTLVEFQ